MLTLFVVLSMGLLAVFAIGVYKEVSPEWKKYQIEYYEELKSDLESKYNNVIDPGEKERLRMQLEALKEEKIGVKQILLRNREVDRCPTCHIDLNTLANKHPTSKHFPFDIYGCTVCHGGEGRALDEEEAHKGIYATKADMWWRLRDSETIFNFWKQLAILTPPQEIGRQKEKEMLDFREFTITGEKAKYYGTESCLKCHKDLASNHIERWGKTKFKTMEIVKNSIDFIEGDQSYKEQCYRCHTTGYDEDTGNYKEEGVRCEACHGPGEVYYYLMNIGKYREASEIAMIGVDYNVCFNCHTARRHEMRFGVFEKGDYQGDWYWHGYDTINENRQEED
jgi:mono/diheme cytochrome c family protein